MFDPQIFLNLVLKTKCPRVASWGWYHAYIFVYIRLDNLNTVNFR